MEKTDHQHERLLFMSFLENRCHRPTRRLGVAHVGFVPKDVVATVNPQSVNVLRPFFGLGLAGQFTSYSSSPVFILT